MNTAYLGLDLHARTCTLGVMDTEGTYHGHQQFPTAESELIPRIVAVDADTKRLAVEASSLSRWAARTIDPYVDEVLVCDPRENRVETAHEFATERSQSFEEVRRITPFNVREGKYEERGYHHFPTAGLSVQYKSAPDVWEGCLKIAEDLGVPVEVEFEWLNKEGASHPGEKGKLSWTPEENGRLGTT